MDDVIQLTIRLELCNYGKPSEVTDPSPPTQCRHLHDNNVKLVCQTSIENTVIVSYIFRWLP